MAPPTLIAGRYEVHETLGSGGMATVYRGTDRVLGRTVAIKVLASNYARDEAFVARFRREAQAAARLNHPGVVSVYDTGSDDGTHYIVMEHVQGKTLADVLKSEGKLLPERAAEIAEAVAGALSFAHQAGLVHRDIKPANIMITPQGEVKVMDFGIARATTSGDTLTQTATVLGTATYLSPEQAQGEPVDARSDIYSLGVVLYEMLAGTPPFTAPSAVAVAAKHVRETPPPITDSGSGLEAIAMKALAKNPDQRFQSAEEMRSAIETVAAGAPASPLTTAPVPEEQTAVLHATTPTRPTKALVATVLAVLGVAAIVAIAILAARDSSSPTRTHRTSPAAVETSPAPGTSPQSESSSTPAVSDAFGALAALISQGTASGDLDEHGAAELQHGLEEAARELQEGDAEKAAEKIADMREKLGELVDKGEVSETLARQIGAAIDVLGAAIGGSADGEEA